MSRILALLCCLFLAACAAPPPPVPEGVVMVAPGIALRLPDPGELGRDVDAAQLVTARHGGDVFVFEGRLSVQRGVLTLAGSDAMGRRAMTVTWSGRALTVERAPWIPDSLRPENVLADIVLLYWPEQVLRRNLSGAELRQDGAGRRVGDAITVTWRGEPWSGVAQLSNRAWDYELDVRSAEVGP